MASEGEEKIPGFTTEQALPARMDCGPSLADRDTGQFHYRGFLLVRGRPSHRPLATQAEGIGKDG